MKSVQQTATAYAVQYIIPEQQSRIAALEVRISPLPPEDVATVSAMLFSHAYSAIALFSNGVASGTAEEKAEHDSGEGT